MKHMQEALMGQKILASLMIANALFGGNAVAADNPDAVWISSLKCSDLITGSGNVNNENVRRFTPWLIGLMTGASTLCSVDLTKMVAVDSFRDGVLSECRREQHASVISASIDGLEFFINAQTFGKPPVSLKDPGPAH
jgi:hypothetical protein